MHPPLLPEPLADEPRHPNRLPTPAPPTTHGPHTSHWPLAVAGPRPNAPLDRHDLAACLDTVDDALVVVNIDGLVIQANASAGRHLPQWPWLARVHGPQPSWRVTAAAAPLQEAIRRAVAQGRHKLLRLPGTPGMAAVQPLAGRPDLALINLGRHRFCSPLTLQCFALAHQLTPAEHGVLDKLLQGQRPADIARAHGVLMSTVRSQITSLRAKTGAPTILALVQGVGLLPPMGGGAGAGPGAGMASGVALSHETGTGAGERPRGTAEPPAGAH